MRVLQLLVFSMLSLWPLKAAACDLALVLAVDVSGSVDAQEYRLQMDGLAAGLRDGVVSEALVRARAQVLLLQWSGGSRQEVTLPWTQVQSFADVEALARQVETAPRPWRNFSTAIGEALELALAQFPAVPECKRRVVDVSGDGFSNEGIEPQELREALAAADVTVNAIAIEQSEPDLTAYFFENVIRGNGAFVVTAASFEDYPSRIRKKLVREIARQTALLHSGGGTAAKALQ
ncbi:VWA domain-containing protein [Rhodobacteraceae bacterium (ex Bugula neritina AB1)]|nr:VWA domain-containing protein [Rhodobacteraceae bacterium (ex Bugula neritina AB1)]